MVDIEKGQIVKSIAGRDKDRFFVVMNADGEFVWLADGDLRKLEKPKQKKIMHVRPTKKCIDMSEITGNQRLKKTLYKLFGENNS